MLSNEFPECNLAYVTPSTTCLTAPNFYTSRNNRQRISNVRRPRSNFSSEWIPVRGLRCECHTARIHCALDGPEGNDKDGHSTKENVKEQWFSGLQVWLRLKPGEEKDNKKRLRTREENEKRDEYNQITNDKSEQPQWWPWQKKSTPEIEKEEVKKKVRHNDSKPGADVNGKVKEEGTLQEGWKKVLSIVAPNINSQREKDEQRDSQIKSTEGNGKHSAEVEENLEKQSIEEKQNGISELYEPPKKLSKETKETLKRQESKDVSKKDPWFKINWTRKQPSENEEIEIETESRGNQRIEKPISKEITIITLPDEKSKSLIEKGDSVSKSEEIVSNKSKEENNSSTENSEQEEKETTTVKKDVTSILAAAQSVETKNQSNTIDIVTIPQRDVAAIRLIFGSETFFATETLSPPGGLIFRGNLRGEPKVALAKLEKRLATRLGDKYTLCLAEGEEDLRPVVVVVPTARDQRPATARQKFMAFVVALMTLTTCAIKGVYSCFLLPTKVSLYGHPPATSIFNRLFYQPAAIAALIATSVGIIIVLSQLVQRFVASRHKTRIAIPFFLPSYQLGCFGAVVQIASPTPTRAALFDIALSGAATLVLMSMICLLIGLRISTSFPSVLPVPMSIASGSLLIGFLTQQFPNGSILVDYNRSLIGLHPLAIIGANCLTIAALNLLPIRQLDGGRIISALYGRKTAVLASRVTILFLLLASSKNPYFIVFLAAITFGPWSVDRPAKNELTEPNAIRTIIGYLFMLLMISILLPYPACKFFGTV